MVSAPVTARPEAYGAGEARRTLEASASSISWAAVIAGAFAAAALALVLLALGAGFGLASVSPWYNSGASAKTFTVITAIWLIIVQWLSSGLGGYLTGRLRTKWVDVHTHEVFFRDTAHGFLAWAVAAVIGASVLAFAMSSLLNGGAVPSGETNQRAVQANPLAYRVDNLFRSEHPDATPNASDKDVRAEATRILSTDVISGDVPASDRAYLVQLVSGRTGLSQADAEKRVDEAIAKTKADADTVRKTGAYVSIYTAVSMLIGAFIASAAAALGGRHRDEDWRAHPGSLR